MLSNMRRSSIEAKCMVHEVLQEMQFDFEIMSKDGAIIKTSRVLLACHSPLLQSLFSSTTTSRVCLPDVSTESISHLLAVLKHGSTTGQGTGDLVVKAIKEVGKLLGIERFPVLTFVMEGNATDRPSDQLMRSEVDLGSAEVDHFSSQDVEDEECEPMAVLPSIPITDIIGEEGDYDDFEEEDQGSLRKVGLGIGKGGKIRGSRVVCSKCCKSINTAELVAHIRTAHPTGVESYSEFHKKHPNNPENEHEPLRKIRRETRLNEIEPYNPRTVAINPKNVRSSVPRKHSSVDPRVIEASNEASPTSGAPSSNSASASAVLPASGELPASGGEPPVLAVRRAPTAHKSTASGLVSKTNDCVVETNKKHHNKEVLEAVPTVLKVDADGENVDENQNQDVILCGVGLCFKAFSRNAGALLVHAESHGSEYGARGTGLRKCTQCVTFSGNRTDLLKHMRKAHTEEKLFKCSFCPAEFSTHVTKIAHEKNRGKKCQKSRK